MEKTCVITYNSTERAVCVGSIVHPSPFPLKYTHFYLLSLSLSSYSSMAQPFSSKLASSFPPVPSPSCTLLFVLFLSILALSVHHHHLHHHHPNDQNALHHRTTFVLSATNYTISSYLRHLTRHPHLAGTPAGLRTAQYVKTHFKDFNFETHMVEFQALLSYPTHSSLSAHFSNATIRDLPVTEAGVDGAGVVRAYHAYSPSGNVVARVVFVNYGREEDYRALGALGVNVSGCVAVARRGEVTRGGVVRKAAEEGAVAVLMYAEGERFRGGVERGTVMEGLGDPLTPGWGGQAGGEALGVEDTEVLKRFTQIPSMPISADTAETILRTLEGPRVPYEWRDGLKFMGGRVGPGPTLVNFTYQGEKRMVPIYNVFGVIRGSEEPDRYVLLGNHRDAWTYGAVDPNSGTAALLDIARRYALLMRLGWSPRRTIILCSWDAEEFGMIGSTEWVEQNLVNLGAKAVAYLNVDCAVQGPGFFARATPQLDDLLVEVTKKIKDPDLEGTTVFETWATSNVINIQRLSAVDSDFAPFVQHAGVPSVDLYYGKDFPVYHTAFDSYNWMKNYGDPTFQRHVAVAGIWGLLAIHLADDAILPFNYLSYATQLEEYTNVLGNMLGETVSLHPITTSIQDLTSAAKEAVEEAKELRKLEAAGNISVLKKRAFNDRLMLAERGFLDADGLPGRQWFKHLVYGPPRNHESKLDFFPGIVDAISQAKESSQERKVAIQHEIWRVSRAIRRAADALRGEKLFT